MTSWTPLTFGKHAGKTLPQVAFLDPDWLFWAWSEAAFGEQGPLYEEARNVVARAQAIRIPDGPDRRKRVAVYHWQVVRKPRFVDLDVSPEEEAPDQSMLVRTRPVIDLGLLRAISNYDKTGYKLLIAAVKQVLFGFAKYKMTKARAEDFFDEDRNFVRGHAGASPVEKVASP
jgi:hypothetical protein